jgi:hypothetical protein
MVFNATFNNISVTLVEETGESLDTSYDKKPVLHLDSSGEIYNTLLENAYIALVR